jgi:hypothetical protein
MGMDHNDGGQGNEMTDWRLWCSTWSWSILSLTSYLGQWHCLPVLFTDLSKG